MRQLRQELIELCHTLDMIDSVRPISAASSSAQLGALRNPEAPVVSAHGALLFVTFLYYALHL